MRSPARALRFVSLAAAALAAATACIPQEPADPPAGTFWLHRPVFAQTGPEALVIDTEGLVSVSGACPAVPGRFIAGNGLIRIEASWERCAEIPGPIHFEGWLDEVDLGTIQGEIDWQPVPPVVVTATKTYGESLRMLTYNVQALPSHFNAGTQPWKHEAIVDEILKVGYDVVALNEVFDEDIRQVYVDGLKNAFPYYVSMLAGDGTTINEDSGLMLFSRWPFEDLPSPTYQTGVPLPGMPYFGYPVICQGSHCSKVAALEFMDCDGDDCFSEKGAGLVRVRNPETGTVANVVFTHLQASYVPGLYPQETEDPGDAEDRVEARRLQLEAIERMIEETLNNGADGIRHFDLEPVFVMGDLNIDGDLTNDDLGPNVLVHPNLYEWKARFDAGSSMFYAGLMRDGWAVANAPEDPSGNFDRGITRAQQWGAYDGARFDYVLWNPAARVCLQHMTLAHNLRYGAGAREGGFGPTGIGDGGWWDLSDHYGVNVDVNLPSPHCSPATAEVVDLEPGELVPLSGTIARPGQIHWYRFDSEGTYSFEMHGPAEADFRVYAADDLTSPAPNYKNETTDLVFDGNVGAPVEFHGKEFRMSEAPFYVRVWLPDRAETGSYTLVALKHDCSTKELACALAPGERYHHELTANPPVGQPDEAWFELYTEEIPTGQAQDLQFLVGRIDPQAGADQVFALEVYRRDGGQDVLVGSETVTSGDYWESTYSWPQGMHALEVSDQQSARVKYWLRVLRQPPYPAPYPAEAQSYDVRWQTNLRILYGAAYGAPNSLQLFCNEENDPALDDGDDEIYVHWLEADGVEVVGQTWIGDFDEGMQESLETVIPQPLYFLDTVELHLMEDDGFLNGDYDWGSASIGEGMGPHQFGPISKSATIDLDNGGRYTFYYSLTRGFDQ